MLRSSTRTLTVAALAGWLMMTAPARAETCNPIDPPTLLGQGYTLVIARPEGREMCFTIAKSAGIAAGRVTVLTVRPVLNASVSDIDVLVTKERSAAKGTRPHHAADLSAPDLLGGAQIFVNADEDRHLTVRVRPRHDQDYRLAVIGHEIEIAGVIGAATIDSIAHIALDIIMREMGLKDARLPFVDHRMLSVGLKAVTGAAKGHSGEEIAASIVIQTAIKEVLAGTDVPREAAIIAAAFITHAWREVAKNALRPFQRPLPDHVRDTSQPSTASLLD